MFINGNLCDIISTLESYKSSFLFNETDIYHIDISVFKNETKQIAISKNKLTPIEDVDEFYNSSTDDTIIWVDKFTYDLLKTPASHNPHQEKPISETTHQKHKTDNTFQKSKHSTKSSEVAKTRSQNKPTQNVILETIHENNNSLIENHDYNCVKVNRPAVFALKKISENYYLLFYRKSVYDSGTDLAFRKYLNEQPGVLAVYKYIHSIDSLRNELIGLGLRLRHNGKNELSNHQVDKLLNTFSSLAFL